MTLADLWFVLFILIVAGYLILDGFDMGVGILHLPFARTDMERRTFLNSIGPVWDGNEVWLVLAGGVLFAVLPARLRLAVLRLLPGLHARPAGDDPADGRARVPQQGGLAPLAIDLGHGVRVGVGRARAAPRGGLRQRAERRADRRRRQHAGLPHRPAHAVRAARRRDDGGDVRGTRRDLPGDEDRG